MSQLWFQGFSANQLCQTVMDGDGHCLANGHWAGAAHSIYPTLIVYNIIKVAVIFNFALYFLVESFPGHDQTLRVEYFGIISFYWNLGMMIIFIYSSFNNDINHTRVWVILFSVFVGQHEQQIRTHVFRNSIPPRSFKLKSMVPWK